MGDMADFITDRFGLEDEDGWDYLYTQEQAVEIFKEYRLDKGGDTSGE